MLLQTKTGIVFVFACFIVFMMNDRIAAQTVEKAIDVVADLIVTDDSRSVGTSSYINVKLTFFNTTEDDIEILPYRSMGKEQLKNARGNLYLHKEHLVVAYIDQMRLTYSQNDRISLPQFIIPFPIAAVISPHNYVEALLQIPTPSKAGVYDLKFEMFPSKGVPDYNSFEIKGKNKKLNFEKIKPFLIEDIEITEGRRD